MLNRQLTEQINRAARWGFFYGFVAGTALTAFVSLLLWGYA